MSIAALNRRINQFQIDHNTKFRLRMTYHTNTKRLIIEIYDNIQYGVVWRVVLSASGRYGYATFDYQEKTYKAAFDNFIKCFINKNRKSLGFIPDPIIDGWSEVLVQWTQKYGIYKIRQ